MFVQLVFHLRVLFFLAFNLKYEGDITFEAFPQMLSNILKYINDIFEKITTDYIIKLFGNTGTSYDTKYFELVLLLVLFVVIITVSLSLIIRLILIPIKIKPYLVNQKPMKDKLKLVYKFISEKVDDKNSVLFLATSISVFAIVTVIALYIFLLSDCNISDKSLGPILFSGLAFGIFKLLLLILKPAIIRRTPIDVETDIYNRWLSNDPEEEKRREKEVEAIKQGFIHLAAKSYSSSSSYCSSNDDALDDLGNAMVEDYGSNWSDGL